MDDAMHVAVLGAGVIGTTTAWYLASAGHAVTVIDRQPGSALETSYANGGQIAASDVEPWANPGTPRRLFRWLGQRDAPLRFRPRWNLQQWRWGLRFLLECSPERTARNTRNLLSLAVFSLESLRALRAEYGLEYDQVAAGILHFYEDEREFDRARHHALALADAGLSVEAVSSGSCLQLEPALSDAADRIVGGIYARGDESGDARKFTDAVALMAAQLGVTFRTTTTVERIEVEGDRVGGVVLRSHDGSLARVSADAYIVALGSFSPLLLGPIGVWIPVFPVKGYSLTIPLESADRAPTMSLTDDTYKLVFSRLGERLRIAGTAEVNGYDTTLDAGRCESILRRVFTLFPHAGKPERAVRWCGLRPATPSNVPVIGGTRYANLYLNTGHGTLGWTLACGSARSIVEIISGRPPPVHFDFVGTPRR